MVKTIKSIERVGDNKRKTGCKQKNPSMFTESGNGRSRGKCYLTILKGVHCFLEPGPVACEQNRMKRRVPMGKGQY